MKHITLLALGLLLSASLFANNIQISNVSYTGQTTSGVNNASNYIMVQFTVSWDNSWRSNALSSYDAAWIFIKYRIGSGDWQHAWLNNTGHTAPAGSNIDIGLLTPGVPFNTTTNPGIGAFLYRSADGTGTFTSTNVQLRWNYGAQGVFDNTQIDLKIFGIEMTYIPQGSFNVGGGNGASGFVSTTINTSDATVVPSGTGSLGGQAGGYPTGQTVPSSGAWPNGYAASYCMKYEISQQQYVDFLNTLNRTQQIARVGTDISGTSITNRYVMTNTAAMLNRNSIRCDAALSSTQPVNFYCDYNGNGIGGEAGDGLWIACNDLNWSDVAAYLDWSGLRPMTEVEYEKICRGFLPAVSSEYAWGNTSAGSANLINNAGLINEVSGTIGSNAVFNSAVQGPIRTGSFAGAATNRVSSGSGYFGNMELSGNLWEKVITIGNTQGRSYNGLHGNGLLSASGFADVANWPDATAAGCGFRGGSWVNTVSVLQVSNRTNAIDQTATRTDYIGGRGVRTAP